MTLVPAIAAQGCKRVLLSLVLPPASKSCKLRSAPQSCKQANRQAAQSIKPTSRQLQSDTQTNTVSHTSLRILLRSQFRQLQYAPVIWRSHRQRFLLTSVLTLPTGVIFSAV